MLINLYKDPDVKRESPKVASRVYIKQPSQVEPRVWDELQMSSGVRNYFESLFQTETRYVLLRNLRYDMLLPVELLCTGKNAKKMCLHIDLRDNLDLILTSLCKVDPQKVRNIPNYSMLSRAILDVALMDIDPGITMNDLLEIEEVRTFFVKNGFLYEPGKFLSSILFRCQDIVWYLSSYLCMKCIAKKQSAIRSIRPAESVIFSNTQVDDVMEIQSGNYIIPVPISSYKPFEYLKEVCL